MSEQESYLSEIVGYLGNEVIDTEIDNDKLYIGIEPDRERYEVFEMFESAVGELEDSESFTYTAANGSSTDGQRVWAVIVEKDPDSIRRYMPRLAYLNDVDLDSEFYLTVANGSEAVQEDIDGDYKRWAVRIFCGAYREKFEADNPSNILGSSISEEDFEELEDLL